MFGQKRKIFGTLAEYCESLKIELTRQGAILRAHCPLPTHNGSDETASFTVYPNDTFYCFGCQEGGDVDRLAFLFGDVTPRLIRKLQRDRDIYARKPATEDQIRLMTKFMGAYKNIPPVVLRYLSLRGISEQDAYKVGLGYCTGRILWAAMKDRKTAYILGLLNNAGFDRLTGKIVIPEIRDDKVIWLQGRALFDETPKYYNVHIQKPLYGWESTQGQDYTWVVEGVFDAISLHLSGQPAVAIIGSHLQDQQIPYFDGMVMVSICCDNDESGRKSTERIAWQLRSTVPIIQIVNLPEDIQDVNDLFAAGRIGEIL